MTRHPTRNTYVPRQRVAHYTRFGRAVSEDSLLHRPLAGCSQVLQEPVAGALEGVHDLGLQLRVLVVSAQRPAVVCAFEELRPSSKAEA